MDDITKLILAKYQVENIIELIKDNEYRQYMFMHLNPVFYELERQLTNLTIADKIKTNSNRGMKSLYIVDYWVPFPQSEYGGVVNLIAGSDAEAFELCADEEGLNHPGYEDRIMPNIIKAQKFALVDEYESAIIDAFTT